MSSPVKVLHIIDSLQKGGAEKLLVDYFFQTHKTQVRFKQFVCTLRQMEDEISLPEGIVRINAGVKKWNIPLVIWKLNKYIEKNNISVIHAHLVDSILISRLLKSSTIRKKVFTYHNFYYNKEFVYYSAWRKVVEKITYRKKYISIYVSKEIQQCIESVRGNGGKDIVLNNFPNPSFSYQYKINNDPQLKAVIVANLRETKNLDLALEECFLLKDLPVSIDIYGEGPLRKKMEEKIKEKKINVSLKGSQTITSELLSKYDVFLLTSESEGLPISLLEAMATGLPSVLPDHLPIFKEVADNCTVFYSIKKPGDLAGKLKEILVNKDQLEALSLCAKERIKFYNAQSYVDKLLNIYNEKNILFLIDTLNVGGAEELLVNTINEMVKEPHFKVHIATTQEGDGFLKKKLPPGAIYNHFCCKGVHFFKGLMHLKKYIVDNNIFIIHSHLENSMAVSRFTVPGNINLLATYHNMEYSPENVYYSRWRVWLEKFTYKSRYISVYVSDSVKEVVERVRKSKPGKSIVMPNFSSTEISAGYTLKPSGSLRLITVANLKKSKNISLLIDVLSDLKDYPISWDVYGEGVLRKKLEAKIAATGSAVKLKGICQISNDTLSPYDLFVLTSFDEGMPIALLEAVNFGLPSLLPDHLKVMREVAGESGIYYPVNKSDELKKILIDLLQNKQQLKQRSDIALERAKLFTKTAYMHKLLKIYDQCN